MINLCIKFYCAFLLLLLKREYICVCIDLRERERDNGEKRGEVRGDEGAARDHKRG